MSLKKFITLLDEYFPFVMGVSSTFSFDIESIVCEDVILAFQHIGSTECKVITVIQDQFLSWVEQWQPKP